MRNRIIRSRFRERVMVTMKSADSYDGILYSGDERTIVLRSCSAVGIGERSTDVILDGELILFIHDIAYIQRP